MCASFSLSDVYFPSTINVVMCMDIRVNGKITLDEFLHYQLMMFVVCKHLTLVQMLFPS